MREFAEAQADPGLQRFSASPHGALYMILDANGVPRRMLRHFDSELPARLVPAFAEVVQAAQSWTERAPNLSRLVRVEQLTERGRDFIVRPFHIYHTSTRSYVRDENPLELPEELDEMRLAFRGASGRTADPKDAIVEAVLARSLLEPTTMTYYGDRLDDPSEGQFIVVEPKVTRDDLEHWAALTPR